MGDRRHMNYIHKDFANSSLHCVSYLRGLGLDWLCWLAGRSKTAHRISFSLLHFNFHLFFFKYEIIVRTSAWSFVIQISIQAVWPSSLKELWLWSVKLQHCSKTAFHTHAFHSIYFLGLEKSPNCVPLNMLKPNLKFNRLWIHYLLLNSFWLIKK